MVVYFEIAARYERIDFSETGVDADVMTAQFQINLFVVARAARFDKTGKRDAVARSVIIITRPNKSFFREISDAEQTV